MVQFLVLNGANVNCPNRYGDTPLYYVTYIVKFLVLNGADVNHQNYKGNTPLHHCTLLRNDSWLLIKAKILLENDADIYIKKAKILLENDADIYIKKAKILLENGADMYIKNNEGMSAYDYVIQSNDNKLIELFEHYNAISNGLDIKEPCVE